MAADRRRGRRDNGLDATDYVAAGDVDPRVGEHLLDVLGTRGVAAYLQPSADVNPVTRHTTIPDRPTDRLWVDRAHLPAARDLLKRLAAEEAGATGSPPGAADAPPPGPPAGSGDQSVPGDQSTPRRSPDGDQSTSGDRLDATFAGIVAGFDRQPDPTAAPWPALEDVPGRSARPEAAPATPEPPRRPAPVDARHVTEPSLLDALDTFGAHLPDESQESYTPPPPPPLPRVSKQAVLGAISVVGGLLLLLMPQLLPVDRVSALLLGFVFLVGGAAALILRLRPGTDPDDDYDPEHGARV